MRPKHQFDKFAKFLQSFWGLLAAFSTSLPAILYLSNIEQIKTSIMSEYYVGVPTVFSLLVIPFVFLYEKPLSSLVVARKVSMVMIGLAFVSIVGFLLIKNIYIYNLEYVDYTGNLYDQKIAMSSDGEVLVKTFENGFDEPFKQEQYVNPLEMVSLLMFTLAIVFSTVSFSSMGLFFYGTQE